MLTSFIMLDSGGGKGEKICGVTSRQPRGKKPLGTRTRPAGGSPILFIRQLCAPPALPPPTAAARWRLVDRCGSGLQAAKVSKNFTQDRLGKGPNP